MQLKGGIDQRNAHEGYLEQRASAQQHGDYSSLVENNVKRCRHSLHRLPSCIAAGALTLLELPVSVLCLCPHYLSAPALYAQLPGSCFYAYEMATCRGYSHGTRS